MPLSQQRKESLIYNFYLWIESLNAALAAKERIGLNTGGMGAISPSQCRSRSKGKNQPHNKWINKINSFR